MSNTAKYIAIAVAIWLVWSYLSTSNTADTGYGSDDCSNKGGCDDADPSDLSAQIPSDKIPGGHLKYARTEVVR